MRQVPDVIYVLEDDAGIRELVTYALESQGLSARGFEYPSDFWKAISGQRPELILLDIMLPEEDGIHILKRLRADSGLRAVPVIMLTAKNTEFDKVTGLDCGADDFVSKPFGMLELLARVRAVLRRAQKGEKPQEYVLSSLSVSIDRREAMVNGKPVALTYKEFELLCALLEHPRQVMTRTMLMERVWGGEFPRENRTLDVHIRTLRAKLGQAGEMIETVRGVGYKIGAGI